MTQKPLHALSYVCEAIVINKSNYFPLYVLGRGLTLLNAPLQLRIEPFCISVLSEVTDVSSEIPLFYKPFNCLL